ncbi:MAG: L,D-transpeptidase [Candidatus Kapaibacteriota bacterium]
MVCLFFASRIFPDQHSQIFRAYSHRFYSNNDGEIKFYFIPIKDTLYYTGDDFIEIDLKNQLAFHISRSGLVDTIKISSGNKYLSKAIETPRGLFAVQNKAPIQISRQFENTEMFNWIGFNGNIGFHGLKKTGYYSSLGRRPTSHGCVRMSNEDGARWFKKIRIGTPVLVYKSIPLRTIKFDHLSNFNPNVDILLQNGNKFYYSLLEQRLSNLLNGEHYRKNLGKVFLAPKVKLINSTIAVDTDVIVSFQQLSLTRKVSNEEKSISTAVVQDYLNISDTCVINNLD